MKKKNLLKNRESGKFAFLIVTLFLLVRLFCSPLSLWVKGVPIIGIPLLNLGLLSMEISIDQNVKSLRIYLLLTLPTFLWVSVTYGFIDLSFLPAQFYLDLLNAYCRFIFCYYLSFLICSFELRLLSRLHARTLRFRSTYFLMKFLVCVMSFLSNKLWRKYVVFIILCFLYLWALYTGNSIVLCFVFPVSYIYTYCSFVVIHFKSTEKLNRILYNKKLERYFPLEPK
jgi:hypothetical protein